MVRPTTRPSWECWSITSSRAAAPATPQPLPAPSVASLHELGERLGAHIRHEERVLSPLIEASLHPHELGALVTAIATAEGSA